jgi:hypothetical protein
LRLSPVIPIVLYTASVPWGSNTRLADLMAGPAEFHVFVQGWQPLFWNLAEHTPEALLAAGPWMQFLAVMRTGEGAPGLFRTTVEQAWQNLVPLATTEAVRWAELLRLIFDYALYRRPAAEHPDLRESLRRVYPGRQEVEVMANTIAEELMRQGAEQAEIRLARRMLRDALKAHCDPLPETLVQQIEAISDLERLLQAHQRAVRLRALDEFTL